MLGFPILTKFWLNKIQIMPFNQLHCKGEELKLHMEFCYYDKSKII